MISKAKPKSEKLLFARFDSFSGAPFFLLCIFSTLQDFSRTLFMGPFLKGCMSEPKAQMKKRGCKTDSLALPQASVK